MKKLLPFFAGAVILILIFVFMPSRKKERKFERRITLGIKDKIPYGCYAAYHLLPQLLPGIPVVNNRDNPQNWKEVSLDSNKQVLLIVTRYFDPTESDLDYLTGLAQRGNCVFISAVEMTFEARKFFKLKQMYLDADKDDRGVEGQAMINLANKFHVRLDTGFTGTRKWYDYPGVQFGNEFTDLDSAYLWPLGYTNNGATNLVGIRTKKGAILLHATPLTFSNFFVLYEQNYEYLQQLMALAPFRPKKIIWDEYFLHNKIIENNKKGLLAVILQYENFRWAFYMTVVVMALYLVTGIKRRQRLIPVMGKPVNESLEFVSVIGKLYFEKGDHGNLALKMVQFFLEQVRTRYHLDTQYINSAFAVQLALKAGIAPEQAGALVMHINNAQMGSMTAAELTVFYELLDNFYKTT